MGISLEEYAKKHPTKPSDAAAEEKTKNWMDRQSEIESALELKKRIMDQIESGEEPQIILYTAIQCIGLMTSDDQFTKHATENLDKVYADLMQQNILANNAARAADRLTEQKRTYNEKLRRSIVRQLAGYNRVAACLSDVLNAIDDIDNKDADEPHK